MANVYAVKSGNWSDTTVWNTGALPTSADNVYSNNFTVTIDGTYTVVIVSNGAQSPAVAGGGFILANGCDLTCTGTVIAQVANSRLFTFSEASPATATLRAAFLLTTDAGSNTLNVAHSGTGTLYCYANVGSTAGSGRIPGSHVILINGGGVLQVTGTVYGGWASGGNAGSYGIFITTLAATVTVNGNCYGNNYGPAIYSNATNSQITVVGNVECFQGNPGINLNLASTLTVTGNVISNNSNVAISVATVSTITITGNITSGGTQNAINLGSTTSIINLTGNVTALSSANGINASGSCTLNLTGTLTSSSTGVAVASTGLATHIFTGPFINTSGVSAFYGSRMLLKSNVSTYMTFTTNDLLVNRTLYTSGYINDQPATSNVRSGVVYGAALDLTGTMAVPAAVSVAYGVPVANTTGTAALSPGDMWNYLTTNINTAGSIGERLKNCSTVASAATQWSTG